MSIKNSNDIGNRTRDLPSCSAVPQPNVPPPHGRFTAAGKADQVWMLWATEKSLACSGMSDLRLAGQ